MHDETIQREKNAGKGTDTYLLCKTCMSVCVF
jgi:hypothetical protein